MWQKELRSASFKTAFFRILINEWCDAAYAKTLDDHKLYIGFEEEFYHYTVLHGVVLRDEATSLICCQEEADTRIIFHLHQVIVQGLTQTVSVRCNDTDVLILLLYHVACDSEVYSLPRACMDNLVFLVPLSEGISI